MRLGSLAAALSVLSAVGCSGDSLSETTPASVVHTEFHSSKFNAGLRYVENSGICETTPGVHTASGYIDIAQNQSLVSSIEVRIDEPWIESFAVVLVLCCARKS